MSAVRSGAVRSSFPTAGGRDALLRTIPAKFGRSNPHQRASPSRHAKLSEWHEKKKRGDCATLVDVDRDQCRNWTSRNANARKRVSSGGTPMSAFRASWWLNDSYWREFPRKPQMPSAHEQGCASRVRPGSWGALRLQSDGKLRATSVGQCLHCKETQWRVDCASCTQVGWHS